MEYTKGDWKAHQGFKVTGQAGLTYVADCYPYTERMGRPTMHEAEANARLIAAAPELYEACQHTLIWLSALIAQNEHLESGKKLARIINEALAKVKEGK